MYLHKRIYNTYIYISRYICIYIIYYNLYGAKKQIIYLKSQIFHIIYGICGLWILTLVTFNYKYIPCDIAINSTFIEVGYQ